MEPQFDKNQLFVKVILGTSYTQFGKSKNEKSEKTIQENENNEQTGLIILPLI